MLDGSPTREQATYSCPCEKTDSSSQTPTRSRDCPGLLLIVMAKDVRTGNCRLFHSIGNSSVEHTEVAH